MRLPTPDCPLCWRRTEDRGDHFECLNCASPQVPVPAEWYREAAGRFGQNAIAMMPLSNYAYREARWAARAAMRAVPELRQESQR